MMHTFAPFSTRVRVAGLVLSLLPAVALAQGRPPACDLGDYDATQRPDPEGTPTKVSIGVSIVRVERVDNVDGSFDIDGFFRLSWRDARLAEVVKAASRPHCRFALSDVWEPSIVIFNRRDTSLELPDVVTVDTEGHVRYIQRIQTTLLAPMDLRDFPMDAQRLPLTFVSFKYGPEDVTLSLDEMAATRETDLSIAGWVIEKIVHRGGAVDVGPGRLGARNHRFARLDYEFRVRRQIAYYVWRVIGPLTLIVLMSWAVFWIDPANFGVQIGLASTSILTVVAFLFSLNNVLPPLPYLTRMDVFLFGSLALAFAAFGEAVMTAVLQARKREELALRIDRWARWVFPSTFAILQLVLWTV